ncbi:PREDICTED: uncharacterized protein LOC107074292 isoform X2 [Polistes dominula]|uniref:Uncharacterized protein LOC107074292 isoform X2 n=2 Tax=Polistes dominula TaxID=743375 RepID=A0ABM1JF19_POLDO|nr:PREDICTED: uncharacterized protein LOC107074292 isoform X2 [Polistes dominula]
MISQSVKKEKSEKMNGSSTKNPNTNEDKNTSTEYGDDQKLLPPVSPTPVIVISKSPSLSFRSRSRYRAGQTRKLRRRAVLKNGDCNVLQSRISRRSLRFLQDIFTTLVDTQWRWTLLCFALSFLLSWLGFAVIWWLIAFTHGDFEERHLPPFQVDNNWTPCIYNIFSFTSCFLFSIETQHTIGYGSRSTTEECPEAIFVMCVQSVAGVMIQAFMVGIVFAKMSRPKQRTQTLLFSKNAVICQRDGELCLMFRVGDMRKSHIIGAAIRAQMIRSRTTKEGEILSQNQHELAVGTDGQNGNLFFIWPTTIVHKINAESPFYNLSAEDILTDRFEVVVILEGTIESTGQTTQARSSYLPQEILWGHRFEPMVMYSKERQGYEVDYSLFDSTTQVDTPLCSGRELAEFYRVQDEIRQGNSVIIDEDQLDFNQDVQSHCYCGLRSSTTTNNYRHHNNNHHHNHNNHHNYHHNNHHNNYHNNYRHLTYVDSARSENSLEDIQPLGKSACKDLHCIGGHGPSMLTNREMGQSKLTDAELDGIQVMGDIEFRHLPEAVNREIIKNSREIVFDEQEVRDSDNYKDEHHGRLNQFGSKKSFIKYHPLLDEERRSLNGSGRNLNNRNFSMGCEEGRRSLNGSRRNLNGSKRFLLLAVDRSNSNRNLNNITNGDNLIIARRHTGSREHLDGIKRKIVSGMKESKEIHDIHETKRRVNNADIEVHSKISIETEKTPNKGKIELREILTNADEGQDFSVRSSIGLQSPVSDLSPESGFFEGNQSSPETSRRFIRVPSISTRNRRSYENAQLQDVNQALSKRNSVSSSSDSDGQQSKTLIADVELMANGKQQNATNSKQTISYTSV